MAMVWKRSISSSTINTTSLPDFIFPKASLITFGASVKPFSIKACCKFGFIFFKFIFFILMQKVLRRILKFLFRLKLSGVLLHFVIHEYFLSNRILLKGLSHRKKMLFVHCHFRRQFSL